MESHESLEATPMMLVTDARGVFDHVNKETLGLPQNRSLALEVTLLRDELGYPGTTLRWTASHNQLADFLTKERDADFWFTVARDGTWNVRNDEEVEKRAMKRASATRRKNLAREPAAVCRADKRPKVIKSDIKDDPAEFDLERVVQALDEEILALRAKLSAELEGLNTEAWGLS